MNIARSSLKAPSQCANLNYRPADGILSLKTPTYHLVLYWEASTIPQVLLSCCFVRKSQAPWSDEKLKNEEGMGMGIGGKDRTVRLLQKLAIFFRAGPVHRYLSRNANIHTVQNLYRLLFRRFIPSTRVCMMCGRTCSHKHKRAGKVA